MAERGGFEPPDRINRSTDFESAAFDHSATSPSACSFCASFYNLSMKTFALCLTERFLSVTLWTFSLLSRGIHARSKKCFFLQRRRFAVKSHPVCKNSICNRNIFVRFAKRMRPRYVRFFGQSAGRCGRLLGCHSLGRSGKIY